MSHPTKEKLISAVLELLESQSLETVTVDMVLKHSGVSKGSLYHHFEDFPVLLEESLVRSFTSSVDQTIATITPMLAGAKTKDDMLAILKKTTRATQHPQQRATRFQRARIIAMSERSDRIRQALSVEQSRLTSALTTLFIDTQNKGWMSQDFDPRTGAVLIQAYTLGKIVDDVTTDPIAPELWNSIIDRLIERVFCD